MSNYSAGKNQSRNKGIKIVVVLVVLVIVAAGLVFFLIKFMNALPTPLLHKIVDGNIIIKAGSYNYYNFTAPSASVRVQGSFSVGNASAIEVYVMDAANFARWQGRQSVSTFYSSGKSTAADVIAALPSAGTYYLVYDNSFDSTSEKNVQTSTYYYVSESRFLG